MIFKSNAKTCNKCGTVCETKFKEGKECLVCPYCNKCGEKDG